MVETAVIISFGLMVDINSISLRRNVKKKREYKSDRTKSQDLRGFDKECYKKLRIDIPQRKHSFQSDQL